MNFERTTRQPWLPLGIFFACLATVLFTVGCGGSDGLQRYDLEGKVIFQGKPVPAGTISFTPDTSQGNSGPGAFAQIRDGQYETPSGKGTVGGPHRVMIFGFPKSMGSENTEEPIPELFPPYQTEVDLPREDASFNFEIPPASQR